MGTSIIVPAHVEARFSKRAPKDSFLPVQSMPVPSKRPHADVNNDADKNSNLTAPNQIFRLNLELEQQMNRDGQYADSQKKIKGFPLTSRDFNQIDDQRSAYLTGESSVWNSLSKETKVHFRQASCKRKMTVHYKSVVFHEELDIKDIQLMKDNDEASSDPKENKIAEEHISEPPKAEKARIKLKSIFSQQELKGSKKRVHLYLENAENILQ